MTTVRRHTRNVRGIHCIVRKHHRKGQKAVIGKNERRVFKAMANQPIEVGGQLDFEKKGLENARVYFGDKEGIEFPYDPDYEVSFHSHPPTKNVSGLPSADDLIDMKRTKEKEQIIFSRDIAISIAEESKFKNVSNAKIKKVSKDMSEDLENGASDKTVYLKYKPVFKRELGLNMKWHKDNTPIRLESYPS